MQHIAGQKGVFRMQPGDRFFGARLEELPDAVPSVSPDEARPFAGEADAPGAATSGPRAYGIAYKGIPVTRAGGFYIVEFLQEDTVRIVAYVDMYARAFTTDAPVNMPPAREPDLLFAYVGAEGKPGQEERGSVIVNEDGMSREVARYRCSKARRAIDRYAFTDTWYRFGDHAANLPYAEAMARAYLAFVFRATLGAPSVPARGLGSVYAQLKGAKPLAAMRSIVAGVRNADADGALAPPPIIRCLAAWLSEGGLDQLDARGVRDGALRLVRTTGYANTFYLSVEDDNAGVGTRALWSLEAALNRFLLVAQELGDRATEASDEECERCDAHVIECVGAQRIDVGAVQDAPQGQAGGEWDVRCSISAAIERLRLPVRMEVAVRVNMAAGAVGFEAAVPDGSFMPSRSANASQRDAVARRYALHVGLLLASIAFDASDNVTRVDIALRPQGDGAVPPSSQGVRAWAAVAFDRGTFNGFGHFMPARTGDPLPPYRACGARFDADDADAFAFIDGQSALSLRRGVSAAGRGMRYKAVESFMGLEGAWNMRIDYEHSYRRQAERIADRLVKASSASDAVRIVRSEQEDARDAGDVHAETACTRLMAALAEGALSASDQNAVVACFLGDDRCMEALAKAKAVAQKQPAHAVRILADAIAEAEALDGLIDGKGKVFRAFDTYAGRVLYNRARCGDAKAPAQAAHDKGKRVELVPDSFYLCHLEIVRLLEQSFERTDEALRYGRRAIEIAPATAAGYRQLGRAYMLVGDMESAERTLIEGLRVAVQPGDIAMLYYQLAYVLWKAGRAQEGAACYVKALASSPMVALQSSAELHELVEESGVAVPSRDAVDDELERLGIPLSPSEEVLEAVGLGAAAATDAGLFPVARNLLMLRLRYRPDDALVSVLKSLDE